MVYESLFWNFGISYFVFGTFGALVFVISNFKAFNFGIRIMEIKIEIRSYFKSLVRLKRTSG